IVFEESTAIIKATPIPLSEPNVVPCAFTQSPSTTILIPSLSKSKMVSLFFWCTISRCACKTTGVLFSIPADAGFLINTLPIWSTSVGRLKLWPKSTMNWITRSSFFEGRGTAFKSAKWFQTALGAKALTSLLILHSIWYLDSQAIHRSFNYFAYFLTQQQPESNTLFAFRF